MIRIIKIETIFEIVPIYSKLVNGNSNGVCHLENFCKSLNLSQTKTVLKYFEMFDKVTKLIFF
jgi:hypothetical protein